MKHAIHSLFAPPIPIDDEGRYAPAPDVPRYHAESLRDEQIEGMKL